MKCKAVRKKLSAYIDQELSPELATQMHTHLQFCPACRKEAEDLKKLWQTMGEWNAPDLLSENFETHMLRRVAKKPTPETWLDKLMPNIKPKSLIQVPAAVLLVLGLILGNYMGAFVYKQQVNQPANDAITSLTGVDDFLKEYNKIYDNIF